MRLQFLPLALCLLFVFITKTSSAFSPDLSSWTNAENVVFKEITDNSVSENMLMTDVKTPESTTKSDNGYTGVSMNLNDSGEIANISKTEGFSYKNSTMVVGGISDFSKNHINTAKNLITTPDLSFSNGLFYGFSTMLLLLNIICYFLFDQKLYLYYSSMLIATLCSFSFDDGLFTAMGMANAAYPELAESVFLLITAGFTSLFASSYLTLKEFYPKFYWGALTFLCAAFIMAGLGWASQSAYFTSIANYISIAVITSYFMIGVLLFSIKNYAKFYVIATFVPLLFFIDYFLIQNIGIDFLLTQSYHLKAAVIFEMLLLSYAIMYRMKAIKEDNLIRQTELRIFLKRQEAMNRKNAMKLMEEVYLENLIMHYDLDGFEIKLLQYISEGKENSVIARKLKVSEDEIDHLTSELYQKLQISDHVRDDVNLVESQPDYIYN